MKRYLLNLFMAALAGAGLAMSACSDEKTEEKVPTPNFPAKVTLPVETGESCTISIDPNQDWSVSIDRTEAGEWFWIDDDGMPAYTVRGKAGKHEIVIRVSDKEENDTDRSIDVSMTMGSQTQVIATVTRGKVERTFDLYLGKKDENGYFTPDSDGKFPYEETAADAANDVIALEWPDVGQSSMRYPIKIVANFQWRLDSKPDWIAELSPSQGKAGETVEILLSADPTAYPLDDEEQQLVFCDYENTNEKFAYKTSIPGCRDKGSVSIDKGAAYTFNAAGEYGNSASGSTTWTYRGPSFSIEAPEITFEDGTRCGSKVYLLTKNSNYYNFYQSPAWLTLSSEVTSGSNVMVETNYTLTGQADTRGKAQTAELLILPAELAHQIDELTDLGDETGMQLKEEYREYVYATLSLDAQTGIFSARDLVSIEKNGDTFRTMEYSNPEDQTAMDAIDPDGTIQYLYRMTYTSAYSKIELTYDELYESCFTSENLPKCVKAFTSEGIGHPMSDSWASVKPIESLTDNDGKRITAPSFRIDMGSEESDRSCFLVFYDTTDQPYAAIYCEYGSGSGEQPGSGFEVKFTNSGQNDTAMLQQITMDSMDGIADYFSSIDSGTNWKDQFSEGLGMGQSLYVLVYYSANPQNTTLTVSAYTQIMTMPWGIEWLQYTERGDGQIDITMTKPEEGDTNKIGRVVLYPEVGNVSSSCYIYCIPEF